MKKRPPYGRTLALHLNLFIKNGEFDDFYPQEDFFVFLVVVQSPLFMGGFLRRPVRLARQ